MRLVSPYALFPSPPSPPPNPTHTHTKHSINQLTSKIKQDLVRGVTASWKVWPLVHVINFRFIPSQQRLLYINSIQVPSVRAHACMYARVYGRSQLAFSPTPL